MSPLSKEPKSKLRLPPLRALVAFESAGRLCNFTRAAAELNVTQAAISYQVKLLEQALGEALFARHPSGLSLTLKGQRYYEALHQAFQLVGEQTDELFGDGCRTRLVINAQPNFAMRWLVPRMPEFQRLHPRLEIVLTTSVEHHDFGRDGFDVRISYGFAPSDLEHHLLFSPAVLPVCSPRALRNGPPLRRPEDLVRHTLVHVISAAGDWQLWCAAAGVPPPSPAAGIQYDNYALALHGAIEGQGVAIGHLPLVLDDLRAGRLVAPVNIVARTEKDWRLLYPRAARNSSGVSAFRAWILKRAAESRRDAEEWLG